MVITVNFLQRVYQTAKKEHTNLSRHPITTNHLWSTYHTDTADISLLTDDFKGPKLWNKTDVKPQLPSRNEQAATLYQNLSLTEPRLIPQLENVIMNFVKEIKQQNSEMENLALAIKR